MQTFSGLLGLGPLGNPIAPNGLPTPARSNPALVLRFDIVPDLLLSERNSIPALARQSPGEEADVLRGHTLWCKVVKKINKKLKKMKTTTFNPNMRATRGWRANRLVQLAVTLTKLQ